jgi:hypothetical protein
MLQHCSQLCGWAAAILAAICIGSFGVPIKLITKVDVDPLIFQVSNSAFGFIATMGMDWTLLCVSQSNSFTTNQFHFEQKDVQNHDQLRNLLASNSSPRPKNNVHRIGNRFGPILGCGGNGWDLRHTECRAGIERWNLVFPECFDILLLGSFCIQRTRQEFAWDGDIGGWIYWYE